MIQPPLTSSFFFFNDTATTEIYTLSLHDALPISFGAIIMCVNVLQWLTGRNIREDAIQAEQELLKGVRVYGTGESPAVPDLVGRIFRVGQAGRTVAELEASATANGGTVTVERIQRKNALVGVDGSLALEAGDIILLVGRRAAVVADRKSTRLNSSHLVISYAVFCLKK